MAGEEPPNTRPSGQPHRQLLKTSRLQVATTDVAAYGYVLDFHSWDILSDLGAHADLIAAVGQTQRRSRRGSDIRFPTTPEATYANHGPKDHQSHADPRVHAHCRIGKRNAEILLLPEYGLSSTSRDLVLKKLSSAEKVPRLVVCGVSAGTDDHGYNRQRRDHDHHDAGRGFARSQSCRKRFTRPKSTASVSTSGGDLRSASSWQKAGRSRPVICFDRDGCTDHRPTRGIRCQPTARAGAKRETATLIGSATSLCYTAKRLSWSQPVRRDG